MLGYVCLMLLFLNISVVSGWSVFFMENTKTNVAEDQEKPLTNLFQIRVTHGEDYESKSHIIVIGNAFVFNQ